MKTWFCNTSRQWTCSSQVAVLPLWSTRMLSSFGTQWPATWQELKVSVCQYPAKACHRNSARSVRGWHIPNYQHDYWMHCHLCDALAMQDGWEGAPKKPKPQAYGQGVDVQRWRLRSIRLVWHSHMILYPLCYSIVRGSLLANTLHPALDFGLAYWTGNDWRLKIQRHLVWATILLGGKGKQRTGSYSFEPGVEWQMLLRTVCMLSWPKTKIDWAAGTGPHLDYRYAVQSHLQIATARWWNFNRMRRWLPIPSPQLAWKLTETRSNRRNLPCTFLQPC